MAGPPRQAKPVYSPRWDRVAALVLWLTVPLAGLCHSSLSRAQSVLALDLKPVTSNAGLPQSPDLRFFERPDGQLWALSNRLLVTHRAGQPVDIPQAPGLVQARIGRTLAVVTSLQVDEIEAPDVDTALRWVAGLRALPGVLSVQPDISQNLRWPVGSPQAVRWGRKIEADEHARRRFMTTQVRPHWDLTGFDPLGAIGARVAWARSQGNGVRVAVIDSGADTQVPTLKLAPLLARFDADEGMKVVARRPASSHGTQVAGLILGRRSAWLPEREFEGVAPQASLIDIQLRSGWTSSFVMALGFAAQTQADVINLSFDIGWLPDPVSRLLTALAEQGRGGLGVVLVAAAGNRPESLDGQARLANHPGVLAVTALDHAGHTVGMAWGRDVRLAAPSDVYGPVPGPDARYEVLSGTSAAAALVSGVAALVLADRPQLSLAQLKRALEASTQPWPASSQPVATPSIPAAFLVRADRALEIARSLQPAAVYP